MKKILLLAIGNFMVYMTMAQSPILKTVKIEFEKKVNTKALFSGMGGRGFGGGNIPDYSSTFFSYISDGTKSVYKNIPEETNTGGRRGGGFGMFGMNQDTWIYTDFKASQQVAVRNVFEKNYLVTDSIGKINWKITNEFREIAGFNCRRATAVIMDSVFVVAFYTDEIIGDGGPESIAGLPGTILGLVINRLHTTWYATKVSVTNVDPAQIVPPADNKAEKINKAKLIESISDRFSGQMGGFINSSVRDRIIWGINI